MSFESGMREFKAGNYETAAHEFLAVTEADENNHKAWNCPRYLSVKDRPV
jgi:hypothetical protein